MIPPPGFLPRLALLLGLLAAGAYGATECVARPWAVRGPSMAPTLRDGDRVLVDVWTYRHRLPRPGEVVVLEAPISRGETLVKRVRAVTTVRGEPRVWVVGDAADRSADSRSFGPVPPGKIRGRVFLRYWPPSGFGAIGSPAASGPATLPGR